jgi:hypothetical protein
MEDLLVPSLQTQPKGWPSDQWHTCRFLMPPTATSEKTSLAIKSDRPQTSVHQLQCHVQLQFVVLKHDGVEANLTDQFCLNEMKAVSNVQGLTPMLKLQVERFADPRQLLKLIHDYRLELTKSNEPRKARRESSDHQRNCFKGGDLVKFEEGFSGVVNYNHHSGDCVADLHLPYGYSTQLRLHAQGIEITMGKLT